MMSGKNHQGPVGSRPTAAWSELQSWAPLLALIVLCLGFGLAEPGFATVENLWTIADRSAIPLILAVGATFIILQGSIDLSVEGVMAASSLTFAMCVLNSRTGLDLGVFGLVLATFAGAGLGMLSGLVTTCLRVPSFMVTLGVWSASMGIAMLLSGGQPPLIKDPMMRSLGLGRSLAVPNLFLVAVTVVLFGYLLQSHTRFGRYSMVIGGGENQARLLGLPVDRYRVLAFAFAGLLSGLGGALESARIGVGHVDIGSGQMFATITAVVIGGTSLSGGRGGVPQSAIGALTLAVLTNGMVFIGITPYAEKAVQGALILFAALVTTWPLRSRLRIVK
jgi:ribose transport system permease protein